MPAEYEIRRKRLTLMKNELDAALMIYCSKDGEKISFTAVNGAMLVSFNSLFRAYNILETCGYRSTVHESADC